MTHIYTDTRPYAYWTITWSALGLEGSAPHGYSCFTAGQVTLPPPSPRPLPRERPHVKATHTGTLSPPQLPALLPVPGSTPGILSPKPTHLLKRLDDKHLERKLTNLWLSNGNLLTGNERKCYNSSFIQPSAKTIYTVNSDITTGYQTSEHF